MTWKAIELVVWHETAGERRVLLTGPRMGHALRVSLEEHDRWGRMYTVTGYGPAGERRELNGTEIETAMEG